MKMKTNKRIWSDLVLALCLLLICIFLACGGFGMINPAQAEGTDPYDWSNYDGLLILDDPEFFMLPEDEDVVHQSQSEEPAAVDDTQEVPEERSETELSNSSTDEIYPEASEQPTDEPAQTEEPPAPIDLSGMFKIEIKVPLDWTNAQAKHVRIKITPKTDSAWDQVKYRLGSGDWVEIKEHFTLLDG